MPKISPFCVEYPVQFIPPKRLYRYLYIYSSTPFAPHTQRQPKIDLRPPTAIKSNYRNHLFAIVNATHRSNVSPKAKEFIFTAHSGASTIPIQRTGQLKQRPTRYHTTNIHLLTRVCVCLYVYCPQLKSKARLATILCAARKLRECLVRERGVAM